MMVRTFKKLCKFPLARFSLDPHSGNQKKYQERQVQNLIGQEDENSYNTKSSFQEKLIIYGLPALIALAFGTTISLIQVNDQKDSRNLPANWQVVLKNGDTFNSSQLGETNYLLTLSLTSGFRDNNILQMISKDIRQTNSKESETIRLIHVTSDEIEKKPSILILNTSPQEIKRLKSQFTHNKILENHNAFLVS